MGRWRSRKVPGLGLALLALAPLAAAAAGQSLGVDAVSLGPLLVHDHVWFDYHIPIKNDPFPHEVKEGYGFDGADVAVGVHWHWGRARLVTQIRGTPASRLHFDYDQDTDFKPTTAFTHGNEGLAHGRTFGVAQELPLFRWAGAWNYRFGLLRQWTRYHAVTTYDWNTNPALPSTTVDRLISERAIIYELRSTVAWSREEHLGPWALRGEIGATPLTEMLLRNYIPVVLAATSANGFGGEAQAGAERRLGGGWSLSFGGQAAVYHGYSHIEGFGRQQFSLDLQLQPPRFW